MIMEYNLYVLDCIDQGKVVNPHYLSFDMQGNSVIIPKAWKRMCQLQGMKTNHDIINVFPNAFLVNMEKQIVPETIITPEINVNNIIERMKNQFDVNSFSIQEKSNLPTCSDCGAINAFIEDTKMGLIICGECGVVNEDMVDQGPEWHQYTGEDNRGGGMNRCGCPSNYFFPKTSQGTIMSEVGNSRISRKQYWNSSVYHEKGLNIVFNYIHKMCKDKDIPKIIIDSTKLLYKKIHDCKHRAGKNQGDYVIVRDPNRTRVIAACVFKAFEMNKYPQSIKEIAAIFNITDKQVTQGLKRAYNIMKNASESDYFEFRQFKTDTKDYIRKSCPQLGISHAHMLLALRITKNCNRMKLASNHNPRPIAAGVLLLMVNYLNLPITKKEITTLLFTSPVTINTIYNKLHPYTEALIDDRLTQHLIQIFKING